MRKRDTRTFRRFVKLADDGTILAVVRVATGAPEPVDGENSLFVDVTPAGVVDVETHPDVKSRVQAAVAADRAKKAPKATPIPSGPPGGPPIGVTKGPFA